MKKIIRYIAGQFGKPAGFGGRLSTFVMNCLNQKMYRSVEKNLQIKETDILLDIGFGNGYLLRRLSKQNPQKLYGVEISKDMIKAVGQKNKVLIQQEKMKLWEADVENMPFEESSIDKAYTINTIYFWQDLDRGFFEINRILKSGGIFLNVLYVKEWLDKLPVTQYGFSKYDVEQITEAAAKSGLKIEDVFEIQPEKSVCIIARKEQK